MHNTNIYLYYRCIIASIVNYMSVVALFRFCISPTMTQVTYQRAFEIKYSPTNNNHFVYNYYFHMSPI